MDTTKKSRIWRSIGASVPVLCSVGITYADQLPETVISASRTEELLKDSPYSVAVIGADELLAGAIRTLPEALKNTPGVMIQKTTHGHGSPYIRGFTGRHNLLLVDGVRINNSTFRSGPVQYWNTVDSSAIDRLELVKGQGAVLYGSDAVGGTLNTLTRSSRFRAFGDGWFNENTASYRFDTNSRSQVGRLESAFGQGGKWGILLGVTTKDFGDIKDSAVGRMKNTGYDELDLDFRFDLAISKETTLTLAHHLVDQDDVWRWHSTIYNPGWNHDGHAVTAGSYNARIFDQERSLTYLKLAGGTGEGWLKQWSATLSYQKSQESEFQDRSPTDIRQQTTDVQTWGLGLQMESDLGAGSLLYGLDYYHDEVDSWGSRTGKDPRTQRPVADDSTYDLLGVFAQYRWTPLVRLPKLETTLGTRYTHADAHLGKNYDASSAQDLSADKDWNNWVVSGRALYHLNDCWNLFAGVSQGFRAPNLNDLSGNLTSRSGLTSLGSLDLEPEKFLTYELGGRYETDRTRLMASVYFTEIESVITGVPATAGSSTSVTTNGQDGQVYGVEAQGEFDLTDNWQLALQASWQEGDTRSSTFVGGPESEEYISRLAPLMGSLSLRWTHPGERFWIEGRVSAAAKADKLSQSDQGDTQRIPTGGTPGYVTASLYAGWQATDDLLLTLGLENLTDEDYRIHGSGQNEAGMNAVLGARLKF
ncbi:MAG: TonB-dependent receptor [Akkermansiaceae bacterium]|nr:TonB-dependent receptor [Akkermansiaceae bacterium]